MLVQTPREHVFELVIILHLLLELCDIKVLHICFTLFVNQGLSRIVFHFLSIVGYKENPHRENDNEEDQAPNHTIRNTYTSRQRLQLSQMGLQ